MDIETELKLAFRDAEIDRLETENAHLQKVISLMQRTIDRYMPCPDCRDKVEAGDCQRCARQRAEADNYYIKKRDNP